MRGSCAAHHHVVELALVSEDVRAIDAVVNIWTPEALAHRPGWGPGFFVGKMNIDATLMQGLSLEQLIDSPVLAGRWFREIPLAADIRPQHFLDLAGDGPEDIELSQEHIDNFSRLVRETGALYKSRHYHSYHFLVTLSDQVAHFGLEHHQSSDDRVNEKTFTDDNSFIEAGLLLLSAPPATQRWVAKRCRQIRLDCSAQHHDPVRLACRGVPRGESFLQGQD